ncbi:uncharacterized protein LOC115990261 [Quercus lobata]|uniref:uncharacterized protein LOC115990261 n=1 Tax=Quercus lobata TaxID=97700 RepID=UPI001248D88F|nr:uncharacterized protein LOC115990261 [Quercus lobata]
MTKENGKGWKDELPIALWAHRIAKSQVTFSLVYGTEAIIPIDLVRPAVKLAEIAGIPREDTLEIMEKMCDNGASHNRLYQANVKAKHEGQVKERKFQVGEFFFGKLPRMYEELLELLNKGFLQNGKDHT